MSDWGNKLLNKLFLFNFHLKFKIVKDDWDEDEEAGSKLAVKESWEDDNIKESWEDEEDTKENWEEDKRKFVINSKCKINFLILTSQAVKTGTQRVKKSSCCRQRS